MLQISFLWNRRNYLLLHAIPLPRRQNQVRQPIQRRPIQVYSKCNYLIVPPLEEEYPDAVFALMVADNLLGQDREQCEINQSAYLSILKGEDIADVRFRYDSAMRKYVERHLWDD